MPLGARAYRTPPAPKTARMGGTKKRRREKPHTNVEASLQEKPSPVNRENEKNETTAFRPPGRAGAASVCDLRPAIAPRALARRRKPARAASAAGRGAGPRKPDHAASTPRGSTSRWAKESPATVGRGAGCPIVWEHEVVLFTQLVPRRPPMFTVFRRTAAGQPGRHSVEMRLLRARAGRVAHSAGNADGIRLEPGEHDGSLRRLV